MTRIVYDIESYPNCFLLCYRIVSDKKTQPKVLEVSNRINQIGRVKDFINYCHENKIEMVGFNNRGFDYPILHKIAARAKFPTDGGSVAEIINKWVNEQIESGKDGFAMTIPDEETLAPQIDLYLIHHFNNKAKATSLKVIEFNMRLDNVEDLPFPVGKYLDEDEIETLIQYNKHDVNVTYQFYEKSLEQVNFREQLTNRLSRNMMNHNDTKIGKDYFIMRLNEAGVATQTVDGRGKRKLLQSKRPFIDIKDCIFPYIQFERPEFIALKKWFERQRITETKGVFSDIPEYKLGDVARYAEMVVKKEKIKDKPAEGDLEKYRKNNPLCWIEEVVLKTREPKYKGGDFKRAYYLCHNVAETLNVVVNGFRLDFGTGGIHGSISNKVAKETERYKLLDADVASYYPNMAISNRIYPEHLSEKFCDIYGDVYEQRKAYAKGTTENGMMKLALNGVYGDSNNQYSPFCDPKYTMSITVGGQLSLCMLIEKLLRIKGLLLVQANTDGVTCAVPKSLEQEYYEVCKQWCATTKLELEFVEYSKMFVRDVNNYVAVSTKGKVKRKGAYQYEDLGHHQNQGGLAIPKAVEQVMLHNKSVKESLRENKDIFDFMMRVKIPRSSSLVIVDENGNDIQQQNVCRYYVSSKGGKMIKIMPPLEEGGEKRRLGIEVDWLVKTCNDVKSFDISDVDYSYYESEVEKLLIGVDNPSKTL